MKTIVVGGICFTKCENREEFLKTDEARGDSYGHKFEPKEYPCLVHSVIDASQDFTREALYLEDVEMLRIELRGEASTPTPGGSE